MENKPKKFDFSRIAELEQQLELEKEKYNFLKDMLNCGLWEYNIKEKKLVQNKSLENGTGGDIANYRQTIKDSNLIYPEDLPIFDKFVDSMDNGEATFSYEMRMLLETDVYIWARFEGYSVKGLSGLPEKIIGRTLNIDKEKNADKVVIKKASSDSVTGLMTTDAFVNFMGNAVAKSSPSDKHAFILVDIDNFAAINKEWGEAYGDYVIETFGPAFASVFAEGDAVTRVQGDAFAAFKRDIKTAKAVVEIAKKIKDTVANLKLKREHELNVNIGVAICPNDGSDFSTLHKKAAIAIASVKGKKDKVCEFYATTLANKPHEVKQTATQDETTESRKIIQEQKQSEYGKVEKYYVDRIMEMLASDETNAKEINKVLAEIGKYYAYNRIYTYNYDKRGRTCFVKYFWNEKPNPYMRVYERIVDAQWEDIYARFSNDNLFICENSHRLNFDIPAELSSVFAPAALMQYKINEDESSVTCISFERPLGQAWNKEEQDFLVSISKLLGIYMDRIRTREMLKAEIEYSRDVMNNQMVSNYAVKKDSYKLVFVGDASGKQLISEEDNLMCYKTVMGKNAPCKNCPLKGIREEGKDRSALESYFEKNQRWYTSVATPVKHDDTEFDFICWTDVTTFVERMKSRDILTNQYTVDKFEQVVEQKLSLVRKPQNIFVYFNIPDFSEINDVWGHNISDEILILFSGAVAENLKEEECLARVTGATFVMMLEYDDKERLMARIEMVLSGGIAAVHRMYPDVKMVANAGVFRMNGHGTSVAEMIENANSARKSIKKVAGNRAEVEIAIYSEMQEAATGATFENFVKSNMRNALANHEFRVFFQPRRNDDGDIVTADVVVRWVTKEGQVIEKDSFKEIMEAEGTIKELDAYMHEETFKLLYEWIERDIKPPVISLACSWQYMFSPEFMSSTKQLLEKYPIPTSLVEFVIPEGVNEGNFYRVTAILQELQAMGFVISLDSYITKFALNNMRNVKALEENPEFKKLDDIQVDVKSNKPLDADDFANVIERK